MYAIVEIGGKQYKVEENQSIVTERLDGNEGDTIEIDRVLMVVDGEDVRVGSPTVKGAKVTATIQNEFKGKKVIVFKKKRRKGYRRKRGHRQYYTALQIDRIEVS